MKKLVGVMFFLCITGCACSEKKEKAFRTALKDTNQALTDCRDDNRRKSEFIQRQHRIVTALKKSRNPADARRKP